MSSGVSEPLRRQGCCLSCVHFSSCFASWTERRNGQYELVRCGFDQVPKSRRTALKREAAKPAWLAEAEDYIRALEGIESVAIHYDGRAISEIHVVSSSDRVPRLISRDVETALKAREIKVDHRVISVAQVRRPASHASNGHTPMEVAPPQVEPDVPEAVVSGMNRPTGLPLRELHSIPGGLRPEPGGNGVHHVPRPLIAAPASEFEDASSRLRFLSVNVMTMGYRSTADVELSCGGQTVLGTQSGISSRLGTPRLVAAAALEALKQLVTDEAEFGLEGMDFLELGGQRLALVAVACLEDRRQRVWVETDLG